MSNCILQQVVRALPDKLDMLGMKDRSGMLGTLELEDKYSLELQDMLDIQESQDTLELLGNYSLEPQGILE